MSTGKKLHRSFNRFHLVAAVVLVISVLFVVGRAMAAQGNKLGTLDTPVHCSSGIGVSVAFDGTYMYFSCNVDPNLYKVQLPLGSVMQANPDTAITGNLVATLNTGVSGGLGAMAWDPGRRKIWAGSLDASRKVYLVDPETGVVTFQFLTPIVNFGFTDGLAYDGSDDTIWFSDDAANTIYHLKTDGTVLGTFSVNFPNSGLAVGGTTLYAGSNGWGTIYKLDKSSGAVLDVFASPGGRDEDIECDDVTFNGVNALWSKDAYSDRVYAFEIPAGSCNTGGSQRSLANVPDYKQLVIPWNCADANQTRDPVWECDVYDWTLVNGARFNKYGYTVGGSGCYITSVVDIMRYWDVTTATNGSDVNPRTINDFLSDEYIDAQGTKVVMISMAVQVGQVFKNIQVARSN